MYYVFRGLAGKMPAFPGFLEVPLRFELKEDYPNAQKVRLVNDNQTLTPWVRCTKHLKGHWRLCD